ncbi:alpha-2-macroglobulin family protein [Silvimonas soli]|uniref:alpha-2-macroglobulin family protein n=1 Tax=Silvimonas soli TaxID=2980100 RepID=UPI0024B3736E|nr:MG2 domain-containing protein [Silvimonas soli]
MLTYCRSALFLIAIAGVQAQAATVSSFSPQNEVREVQQVRATFSAPMIRMGSVGAAAPFDVDCAQKGDAHWIDDQTWVMDFPQGLPGQTACRFNVKPTLKTLAGEEITGTRQFRFTTGPLAVVESAPDSGSEIDEDQTFVLRYNGKITGPIPLFCQVEGSPERLPAQRISAADKATLIKHLDWQKQAANIDAIDCGQRLPAGKKVKLVLERPGSKEKQTLDFTVREAFAASFTCERESAKAACIPLRPVTLRFSAQVQRKRAEQIVLQTPDGERKPDFGRDSGGTVYEATFKPPFSPSAAFKIKLPDGFVDENGRELTNQAAFPLAFSTALAPPLAKFAAAPFGIVELNADPAIAVTLRDVEADLNVKQIQVGVDSLTVTDDQSMMTWLAKVQNWHESYAHIKGKDVETRRLSLLAGQKGVQSMPVPTSPDKNGKWPFSVVGIPAKEPGLHVVELQSRLLGKSLLGLEAPMYVRTAMLITNLGVHLKRGRENAAVWVTTLDRAQPVADAQVSIYDCRRTLLWQGKTDSKGVASIDHALEEYGNCPAGSLDGLFVTARKKDAQGRDDVSFVRSGWNQGIESWRFPVPTDMSPQPSVRATTVFDRPLFRAGETVSMKHFMRVETSKGLSLPRASQLPDQMVITHDGSGQSFKYPLTWRQGRYAESTFAIPKTAKLGMYSVSLTRKPNRGEGDKGEASIDRDGITLYTGTFRVEEFRLPVMRGQLSADAKTTAAPTSVPLNVSLSYGTGGPAKGLPIQVSAMLRDRYDRVEGYDNFSFSAPETARGEQQKSLDGKVVLDKSALTLDANGNAKTAVKDLPKLDRPYDMVMEATYADPNGEVQTLSRTVALWPSAVRIGLNVDDWVSVGKSAGLKAVVLDTNGKPVVGRNVTVKAVEHEYLSSRKRLVGGFYAYDHQETTKDLGNVCDGKTDSRGLVFCDISLKNEGSIELIAQTDDGASHPASASQRIWVTREGEMWFDVDNNDRIDVLPEKTSYQPGDTARLQVRMPFRKATAWLAIEREGVIETRVVELSGKDPSIDLKIEPQWAPNVYVSVLAVRGRVREVPWYSFFTWGWRTPLDWWDAFRNEGRDYQAPTAMVDLSRPAFKYGMAELTIGTAGHKLAVTVTPDKQTYSIRKTATVKVQVKLPNGQPAPAGSEVAFAAVDEALLELQPNTSWDLLTAMLQRRSYGVETSTAQLQVVGKRHFGRKALAPGGGGGFAPTRELLDTLLTWQPHVVLDKTGSATVTVPLNDALTRFKLVAVADSGDAYFGTGSASITVTQDVQITSGIPPLARSGDQVDAGINIRNGSSRVMTMLVEAQAAGLPPLNAQTVQIPAGEAREVKWPVTVPAGISSLQWTLSAKEQGGEKAQDKLAFKQDIEPATPVTVQQATLRQITGEVSIPVGLPQGAEPGRGGVSVQLQAKLGGDMPAVRDWFLRYPYSCLEQRSSIAIGLNDKTRWDAIMADLPSYLDADGLAQYFPVQEGSRSMGSDTLTAYLLAVSNDAGWKIPDDSRERMLTALTNFVEGKLKRDLWMPRDSGDARRLAALEALSRYGRALPRQLDTLTVQLNSWSTGMVIDWMSLLQHMPTAPDRAAKLAQAEQLLRGRLTYQGTRMVFSTERDDYWWWLMGNADVNSARLVLVASQMPTFKDDMPRLLTGLLGRQERGAWWTTNANAWGSLAVRHFSAQFESQPVTGQVNLALGNSKQSVTWQSALPPKVDLPWPANGQGTLGLTQQGTGSPWATVQVSAALPLTAPQTAGYRIKKTVTPVETKVAGQYSRGDVVRVKLEITAQADMTWVVVDDPVPTGASILGNGLGRDSQIATQGEQQSGDAWPAYVERRFAGYRAYYEYIPRGSFTVEYTMRLNNTGTFKLPPSRVEALYAPDVFGAAPNAVFKVNDAR